MVVESADGRPVTVGHVCGAAMKAVGLDGAAVTVMLAATPRETVYSSGMVASELAELELILGEGPCVDAFAGSPVLVADLKAEDCRVRWPVYAPAAAQAGVLAVFALPLRVGGIGLGVLVLHRARPGELGPDQLADALMSADTVCALLLDLAADSRLFPDGRWLELAGAQHAEVHRATGMVSVQLGVSVDVALARLRAHAYANDLPLRDVAADVVARRLRLRPAGDGNDNGDDNGGDGR